MNTKKLKQLVLDLAIHGKLVPQDPNDEPASELLKRIVETHGRASNIGRASNKKSAISSEEIDEVPFDVPKGWVWCKLGEIGKWQSGSTPSRSNKRFYGGDIPWLKTGDLNDGFITDIPEYITEEALKNTSVKLNPTDSVLIAMYGATIGKVGILTFPATTNQACCACSEYFLNKMYLFYFLIQERENFISKAGGGAQPNISKEIIVDTLIPLPPLSEQRRIVSEIEKWFGIIDQLESNEADLRKSIEQTKKKVLDLAIHGKLVEQDPNDEPASVLLERIKAEKSKTSKGKKTTNPSDNLDEVPFDVPEGWVWCKVTDILSKITDGTHHSPTNLSQGEYMYITAKNIKPHGVDLTDVTYVDKATHDEIYARCNPKFGDILYIKDGATTGIACINNLKEPFSLLSSVALLKPSKFVDAEFLLRYLQSSFCYSSVRETMKGVGITRITLKLIGEWFIPLPPLSEQRRIVAKIEEVFGELDRMLEMIG